MAAKLASPRQRRGCSSAAVLQGARGVEGGLQPAVQSSVPYHLALQAAADALGVRVHLITSYERNGYLQIEPLRRQSREAEIPPVAATLWLSFWAEVHYNSVRERS